MTKEDWEFVVKNCKRSNVLDGVERNSIIYLSYNFVKIELPSLLTSGDINAIVQAYRAETLIKKWYHKVFKPRYRNKVQENLYFALWLKDELEKVYNLEKEYLSSTPDNDLLEAGVKDLDELGELNLIDSLAGGDILKWEAVKKLPYHMIFDKQRKTVLEGRVQKKLGEILRRKSKQRSK